MRRACPPHECVATGPNPPGGRRYPRRVDRHTLYELCVQSPAHLVPLLRAIHGGAPRVLGEDFAGTAALSRVWAATVPGGSAVAVDLDPDALAKHPPTPGIVTRCADVREVTDPADVVFVGNFSIGYLHTRTDLVAYLRHARSRLAPLATTPRMSAANPADRSGVFVCDTYGGASAFATGFTHRPHPIPKALDGIGGRICRYTWEQREADPLTGMVTDAIHFRIEDCGEIVEQLDDAFLYRWRLWGVPELRDAMAEAGFASTEVYATLADAMDDEGNAYATPVEDPQEELEESFIVLVAAHH